MKPINHATILKKALTKTGQQRTLGIISAWRCWCEMLADACEEMRELEQQAIVEGVHDKFIATCGNPMKPAFYDDGRDILDLLVKEALSQSIPAAPFIEAKKFLNGGVRLSDRQCGLPIEEQNQVAALQVGRCQAEIESAIMLLSAEPNQDGWFTITDATKLANVDKGVVGAGAKAGRIKDNGKSGPDRRIDPVSLNAWMLKRADRPRQPSIQETEQAIAEAQKVKATLTPRDQNRETMKRRVDAGTL